MIQDSVPVPNGNRDQCPGSNSWTQRQAQRLLEWLSDGRMPLLAVALFTLTRVLQIALVMFLESPEDLQRLAWKGDAGWYTRLAEYGYTIPTEAGLESEDRHNARSLAFFPLYPSLIRLASTAGIPAPGVVIASIAALVAAWGLFRLGENIANARTGVVLAVLWGCLPGSIVLSMGLSEPLFTALAVWCLFFLLRGNLLIAAMLSLVAGLTRPTSVAVVLAVLWVAVPIAAGGPNRARGLVAMVVAPLGLVAYLSYVAASVGSPLGYLTIQAKWGSRSDWGVTVLHGIQEYLFVLDLPHTVAVWSIAASIVLLIWLVLIRPPAPILVYSLAVVFPILVQSNYLHTRIRFLTVAFTLLIPPAMVLGKTKPWLATVVLGAAAVASAVFGAWFLSDWSKSI